MRAAKKKIAASPELDALRNAYELIIADIKRTILSDERLKHCNAYISVDEASRFAAVDDTFYTPCITVRLLESNGRYFFYYYLNVCFDGSFDASGLARLARCVYERTCSRNTLLNIEGQVEAYPYDLCSYEQAFIYYENGNKKYKPCKIE